MPRTPLRFLVTAVAIPALAAACTTRLADDDRTEVEFWGTVSAETEAGVRALSDEARAELLTPQGDERLRTLILSSIDSGLAAPRERR